MDQRYSRRRSKKRRRWLSSLTRRAVLLGTGLTGVAAAAYFLRGSADDGSVQTSAAVSALGLQLPGLVTAEHAGDLVASMDGQELQIALRAGGTDIDPVGEVISARSTFGLVSPIQFMIACDKGAPIVAFGAEFLDSPVAFFAIETSKIKSPVDFRGVRVPRQRGSDAAIIYDAVLANLGISRSEIKESDKQASVSMLLDGAIDVLPGKLAATGYELKKMGVPYTVMRPGDYGIHVPGSVYFTHQRTLRDHPSIASKFLQKIIAGWQKVYADENSAAELVTAAVGVSQDQAYFELRAQRDLVLPIERRIAEFDSQQWKQLRIILLQERLIREEADFSATVDYSVLKDVYRRPLSFGR